MTVADLADVLEYLGARSLTLRRDPGKGWHARLTVNGQAPAGVASHWVPTAGEAIKQALVRGQAQKGTP